MLVATTSLAGCDHVQHGDVLIFATQTQVALDVSASATTGGTPNFTLGYKRVEGVWMPLVINGRDSVILAEQRVCAKDGKACYTVPAAGLTAFQECATKAPPADCLKALAGDIKYTGSIGTDRKDAYSVFASFGGDFGANTSGSKAALAQFFATGIAAQKLAESDGVAKALKAEDTNEQVVDAQAAALKAQNQALQLAGANNVAPAVAPIVKSRDATIACWNSNRTAYRATAKSKLPAGSDLLKIIDADDEEAFRGYYVMMSNDRAAIDGISSATCP